jgi:hypothetical protein
LSFWTFHFIISATQPLLKVPGTDQGRKRESRTQQQCKKEVQSQAVEQRRVSDGKMDLWKKVRESSKENRSSEWNDQEYKDDLIRIFFYKNQSIYENLTWKSKKCFYLLPSLNFARSIPIFLQNHIHI